MRFRAWSTGWRASVTFPTAGGSCCRCRRHGIPGPIGAMTCAMRRMLGLRASRCWRGRGGFEMGASYTRVSEIVRRCVEDLVAVGVAREVAERHVLPLELASVESIMHSHRDQL